jgi:hypothetical protein
MQRLSKKLSKSHLLMLVVVLLACMLAPASVHAVREDELSPVVRLTTG